MYTATEYIFPESIEESYQLLISNKNNAIIGGGLWMRLSSKNYHTLIDLSKLGMDKIEKRDNEIVIGAMVSLYDIETNPLTKNLFAGALADSVSSIVGIQMRNSATIGGSIYSRFGFSDPLCALLAMDAEVELFEEGRIPIDDFIHSDRKKDILIAIHIKDDGRKCAFESLRQTKTDFAVLNLCLGLLNDGSYRVAVGARPTCARRCFKTEEALLENDINRALEQIEKMPYGSNMRGSEEYRSKMSSVLLKKAYEKIGGKISED